MMARIRKWLILSHRYLGIALGLLFVVWFASGIGMIYARGKPPNGRVSATRWGESRSSW